MRLLAALAPLPALRLTMASADSKANALLSPVKDHVEALHDHCPHDSASGGLGDSKLVALVLGGSHILDRP